MHRLKRHYEEKKQKSRISRQDSQIVHSYYETNCSYCDSYFCRQERSRNDIEKYLDVFCCPKCGAPNIINKSKKDIPGRCSFTLVPEFSLGFEIEFHIPNKEKEAQYLLRVSNPLQDNFGFDGAGPIKKEFRSDPIFNENPIACIDEFLISLDKAVKEIKQLGGRLQKYKIIDWKLQTFGIHISMGGDFYFYTDNYFGRGYSFTSTLEKFVPFDPLRKKLIERLKYKVNRGEFRLFGSSENDLKQIKKALLTIRKELITGY